MRQDFEATEKRGYVKAMMRVDEGYYTALPPEPTADEVAVGAAAPVSVMHVTSDGAPIRMGGPQ